MSRREITYRAGLPPVSVSVMDVFNMGCHWHDALEVIWVLSGEIAMKESNLLCKLKQGDVYVVNYNETHKISTDGGPATIISVHIDYRYFTKYIPNLKEISYTHYFFSRNLDLEDSLEECRKSIKELYRLTCFDEGEGSKWKIESAAHSLLLLLIDTFQYVYYEKHDNTYHDFIDRSNNLSHEQLKRLHRLTHYIYTHCHDRLTLDDVAGTEYYSRFYVSHFIKKAYGLSYQETVCLSRVMISERLLIGTPYNMDSIAEMVGFSTRNQYCRQFKKWHGISPSQFRKENAPGSPGSNDLTLNCDEKKISDLLAPLS